MSCECNEKYTRNYYRYYDTPDGCDIDKKTMVAARYGIIAGLVAGSYDVLMYSHAVGLVPILSRYAKHVVPLGLMGATFALVSNGLLIARKRDDSLNYFLGGLACGPILAAYIGSGHGIVAGGIVLGIAAKIKKDAICSGTTFFPAIPDHMNMVDSWRHDWTLAPDPRDAMRHTCGKDQK